MRPSLIVISVLVTAVIAAGCGGSGADGSAGTAPSSTGSERDVANSDSGRAESPAPLTKAAFIKLGDEICRRGAARILSELQRHKTEYGRGFGAQPSQKQNEEGIVDLVLPVIEDEADEISELSAPRGEKAKIAAIVRALETGAAQTEAKPSTALSGPNPLDEAAKLSKKYGFKICGA
jgi:hypothetical protein